MTPFALSTVEKKDLKILIIDDEQGVRDLLSYELGSQGYDVKTARDGLEALELLKNENFRVVISDIKMPKMDGLKTLEEIKKINPGTEVIMATGYGTIETAIASMKKGAYDFIQKPFNVDEIVSLVEKALEKAELKALITLYETSKAIFSATKIEVLLPVLVKLAVQLLKADDASILLLDERQQLSIAASIGLADDASNKVRLDIGERVVGKIKESLLITGPLSDTPRFQDMQDGNDITSALVVPLVTKQQMIGVLCSARTHNKAHFTASEKQYAQIFSSQISQAIENAQLYATLETKIKDLNEAYAKLSVMQNELVQTEKLAAIGELASGVAHELNNPLTVVIGLTQLLLEEGELSAEKRNDLETVKSQAERCKKIILNLLQFARKHEAHKTNVRLDSVMEKTIDLIVYEMQSSGVNVTKEFEPDLPEVEGDVFQLQQVFLNIINNACYSLRTIHNPQLTISIKKKGNSILVSIADNGPGIPKNIIHRIFEPFFTTKEVKSGTGLGLSISYGIIKEHGGSIFVQSEEGTGSTFTIELPVAAAAGNNEQMNTGVVR